MRVHDIAIPKDDLANYEDWENSFASVQREYRGANGIATATTETQRMAKRYERRHAHEQEMLSIRARADIRITFYHTKMKKNHDKDPEYGVD